MDLVSLGPQGVFGIISNSTFDERGAFARVWDESIFLDSMKLIQASVATNPKKGTLRGLHFQSSDFAENKIVQCISGSVFDVVVDLREDSSTFRQHFSIQLGIEQEYQGILVPKGFAHGYLTLSPNSTLLYFMDNVHAPEFAMGLNWNDPALKIPWPSSPRVMSNRDRNFPMLNSL